MNKYNIFDASIIEKNREYFYKDLIKIRKKLWKKKKVDKEKVGKEKIMKLFKKKSKKCMVLNWSDCISLPEKDIFMDAISKIMDKNSLSDLNISKVIDFLVEREKKLWKDYANIQASTILLSELSQKMNFI